MVVTEERTMINNILTEPRGKQMEDRKTFPQEEEEDESDEEDSPLKLRAKLESQRADYEMEEEEDDLVAPSPPDGGWGWVVCAASFLCNMILDGIAYCFGVLLTPLCK